MKNNFIFGDVISMEYVLIVGKCIVRVRILKMNDKPKPYKLHKIDENGDLWIYWNGWYKVADENNPLKYFKKEKK